MKEVREQILFDRRHLLGNDLEQWRPSQPISNRENFDQEAIKLADRFGWKLGALIAVFDADLEQVCTVQLGDYAKARFGFHPWVLPGGSVDPGEAPSNAAIREFQEETGLALIPQVVPAGWFPRTYFKPHDRETIGELLLLFAATIETPLTPTQSSLEIRAVRWRRVNELRNDTVQPEGVDRLLVPHMLWCLAARGVLKHRLHPLCSMLTEKLMRHVSRPGTTGGVASLPLIARMSGLNF